METSKSMEIYNAMRSVPKDAQKVIAGGPLKGFTDINPMWRIKTLTEHFGSCGQGWVIKDVKTWTSSGAGEEAVFVSLNLYVKYGEEWSEPIFGIGGSKSLVVDKNGPHLDDEAYKKAYTDAISIACKALGMAADIYFASDVKTRDNITKYDTIPGKVSTPADKPAETAQKTAITGALVKAGKCTKIVQYLAGFDPDDFMQYNQGLKKVEEKYDITTDGYNALEFAVRAIRKANTANA